MSMGEIRFGCAALLLSATTLVTATPQDALAGAPRPSPMARGNIKMQPLNAGRLTTLYDQTGFDSGTGFVSQNFEATFDVYDCEGADDFIVPDGSTWVVKEVDIEGNTGDGDGRADSENVVFYKDKHGKPGKVVARFDGIVGLQTFGAFVIDLGKGVRLKPGRYWLSMQVNEIFNEDGEWYWEMSTVQLLKPSVWRNPGDGFATGCTDWRVQTDCYDYVTGDQMFALKGRALTKR